MSLININDIYFNNVGVGPRILVKNTGNLLQHTFTFETIFLNYGGSIYNSQTSSYIADASFNYFTIVSMGGGVTESFNLVLDTSGNDHLAIIYEDGGFVKLDVSGAIINIGERYFIKISVERVNAGSTNIELYLRSITNPANAAFTYTRNIASAFQFANQGAIGCVNDSTTFTQSYYNFDGYRLYAAQNMAFNFCRFWDTAITNTNAPILYNLDLSANRFSTGYIYNVTLNGTYPENFTVGTQTNQKLLLQIDGRNANVGDLTTLYNTARLQTATPNGEPPTVTNSATGYATLEDFGINSSATTLLLSCLDESTRVLTPFGYKPIKELRINEFVITSSGRKSRITDITTRKHTNEFIENMPFLIPKDSIRDNYPPEDSLLSSKHKFLLEHNKWITPEDYSKINDKIIRYTEKKLVTYYHIHLENYKTDDLVINNGFIVESLGDWIDVYTSNNDGTFSK